MMNILTWYGLENIKIFFQGYYESELKDLTLRYHCMIFLRSKHRPDCYYAEGDEQNSYQPGYCRNEWHISCCPGRRFFPN